MTQPLIDISIQHKAWSHEFRDLQNTVLTAIAMTLEKAEVNADGQEISLVFADDGFVQNLNNEWRGKDKPTNVLSFPQDDEDMLGDIILAFDTVKREAEEQDKRFEEHGVHLIVHGLLHLLGHDHIEDDEAEIMEALEIQILEALNIKNPYQPIEDVA